MFGSQTSLALHSLASIIPVIIILFYVYKRDLFPEPPRIVISTFFLGVASILPIQLLIPLVEGIGENLNLQGVDYYYYLSFICSWDRTTYQTCISSLRHNRNRIFEAKLHNFNYRFNIFREKKYFSCSFEFTSPVNTMILN